MLSSSNDTCAEGEATHQGPTNRDTQKPHDCRAMKGAEGRRDDKSNCHQLSYQNHFDHHCTRHSRFQQDMKFTCGITRKRRVSENFDRWRPLRTDFCLSVRLQSPQQASSYRGLDRAASASGPRCVSSKAAERMAGMKKADIAEAAERLLAPTDWRPSLLRTAKPQGRARRRVR